MPEPAMSRGFGMALDEAAVRGRDMNAPVPKAVRPQKISSAVEPLMFALIPQPTVEHLAASMPDLGSAVLLLLSWHACITLRMHRGVDAGKPVARVSARRMSEMTGRPIRNVRRVLATLQERGLITKVGREPGKTARYAVKLSSNHATCY